MENPTLPANWLAALSNARSASRWVTLAQQEPRRHDTADSCVLSVASVSFVAERTMPSETL